MKFGLQIYSCTRPDGTWPIGAPDSELQPMREGWTTLGCMAAHSQRARFGLMVGSAAASPNRESRAWR